MKTSCYDCHSNNTKYPWYSEVAPISWWIADHVTEGKDELNLSLWTTFSDKKRNHKLEEMIELIEKKEMPLESYLPMHSEAELSESQQQELITFFREIKFQIKISEKK